MSTSLRQRLNITKKPIKRDLHGVILLNKPQGFSSNAALQKVKYHLMARKAGHTGSLDPLATGVLPICLGRATKFAQYLLDADKTYIFTVKFGQQTATADLEGDIIAEKAVPEVNKDILQDKCDSFVGDYAQVPPMYSALKKDGQPLYKLARQGKTVERPARNVKIYSLDVISGADADWTLQVKCSKGTYVRTLAEDIAAKLNTLGHVTMLTRTAIGAIDIADAVALDSILAEKSYNKYIRPVGSLLGHMPRYAISLLQQRALSLGKKITVQNDLIADTHYALQDSSGSIVGVASAASCATLSCVKMLS